MQSLHAMDGRVQTQTLAYCNFIRYWNVVDSLQWHVESTLKLDSKRVNIFLWVSIVLAQAPNSWIHICFEEFGFLVHKCALGFF